MISSLIATFDALLFDLDGTLAHSMPQHNDAWVECLRSVGYLVNHDILQEYAGVPTEKTVQIFNERYAWQLDPVAVAALKEEFFLKKISLIRPIDSALEIVQKYKNNKPMAIVSGGKRFMVEQILQAIGLAEDFPIRICADDVSRGKPYPDSFLLAANILGVEPQKCLVFEDGIAGIQGAKAAGMRVIKVDSELQLSTVP